MWAFAADSFNMRTGQRLFVVIMLGANVGALAGAKFTDLAVERLSPFGLMIIATCTLVSTLLLARPERAAVPRGSRAVAHQRRDPPRARALGGIALVLRDRYLLLIAVFVLLLNWINSTGEFILADFVKAHAEGHIAAGEADASLHCLVLRQFPVLGDAGQPGNPVAAGIAHLPSRRHTGCAAGPPHHCRRGLWAAGPCAGARRFHPDFLADPPHQGGRQRCGLFIDEHHAADAVPAGGQRLEVRGQDGHRYVLRALR